MHVIAARPSIGKTALATCIAYNMAKAGEPVMFFSLEMGRRPLTRRILSVETGIPYKTLEAGNLSEERIERLRAARDKFRTIPFIIDDNSTPTLGSIRTKVRRQQAKTGLKAFFFDYLQLACKDQEDRGEISMWSRGLRAIAKDLGIVFVPIVQLSRYPDHRDDPRPKKADLKGSSQIEQDADTISFLFHKDDTNKLWTTWYVDKHRNGPCGDIELEFQNRTTLFRERGDNGAPF
jgi:replicative DNA helicase